MLDMHLILMSGEERLFYSVFETLPWTFWTTVNGVDLKTVLYWNRHKQSAQILFNSPVVGNEQTFQVSPYYSSAFSSGRHSE